MKLNGLEVGGRHNEPHSLELSGDQDVALGYYDEARILLGNLKYAMRLNGIINGKTQLTLRDGSIIVANSFTGGRADIDQLYIVGAGQESPTSTTSDNLEIPIVVGLEVLGFVIKVFSGYDTEYTNILNLTCTYPDKLNAFDSPSGFSDLSTFEGGFPDHGAKWSYSDDGNFNSISYSHSGWNNGSGSLYDVYHSSPCDIMRRTDGNGFTMKGAVSYVEGESKITFGTANVGSFIPTLPSDATGAAFGYFLPSSKNLVLNLDNEILRAGNGSDSIAIPAFYGYYWRSDHQPYITAEEVNKANAVMQSYDPNSPNAWIDFIQVAPAHTYTSWIVTVSPFEFPLATSMMVGDYVFDVDEDFGESSAQYRRAEVTLLLSDGSYKTVTLGNTLERPDIIALGILDGTKDSVWDSQIKVTVGSLFKEGETVTLVKKKSNA